MKTIYIAMHGSSVLAAFSSEEAAINCILADAIRYGGRKNEEYFKKQFDEYGCIGTWAVEETELY